MARITDRISDQFWRIPNRLAQVHARWMIALACFVLILAALGLFIYDGVQRVAYVSAMGSIGLSNLAWGAGSLLPDEQRGRTMRALTRPLFLVMVVTLPVAAYLALRS